MVKIPRVALFKADETSASEQEDLFKKHEYGLRVVKRIDQVTELIVEEGDSFDTIIIPLQLYDGSSGITNCIQIKSDELLASTPIVGLSHSKDQAVIQAFFGAGADIVLNAPFDADQLYLQIGALCRLKRAFDEKLNREYQESGLIHPVMEGFHSVREAVLLWDTNYNVLFVNQSGRAMLGLSENYSNTELKQLGAQLKPFVKEHDSEMRLQPLEEHYEHRSTLTDTSVIRIDKRSFRARLTVTTLTRGPSDVVGYSMAITDLSEIQHLSNTLLQGQKTRSLCLLTTAATINLLEQMHRQRILSPTKYIDDLLSRSQRSCALNSSITSLLETLDLVINPNMSIRVKVDQDLHLAVRQADFFQMIGLLILHAVEYAGTSGETSIHTSNNVPGQGVSITITSESKRVTPFAKEDQMASLIQGDFEEITRTGDVGGAQNFGLYAAQKIAERYRTTVQYQQPNETIIKIRVLLPAGRPTQVAS